MTIKDINDATLRMWHAMEVARGVMESIRDEVRSGKRAAALSPLVEGQLKEAKDHLFGVRHNLGLPEGTPDKDLPGAVHKLRCDIWNLEKKLETANAALTAERSTILKIRETLGCQ